jgi:hypothetical protein
MGSWTGTPAAPRRVGRPLVVKRLGVAETVPGPLNALHDLLFSPDTITARIQTAWSPAPAASFRREPATSYRDSGRVLRRDADVAGTQRAGPEKEGSKTA